jgi:hypothetical protein
MEWYVIVEGEPRGPMSKASVQRLIELGVVTSSTPVKKGGMKNWLQIGHIRDFEPQQTVAKAAVIDEPRKRLKLQKKEPRWSWQRLIRLFRR